VVTITAHAVTDDFGIDSRAPAFCVFVFFQDHHTSAFAHDKTIAVFVEGTAGFGGFFVSGGERAGRDKTGHAQFAQRGFGTAGDHNVGHVEIDVS